MHDSLYYYLEELKLPIDSDLSPEDWKDWYHYIIFSPDEKIRFLFNISLSGRPNRGEVTITALITFPDPENKTHFKNHGFMISENWEAISLTRRPLKIQIKDYFHFELQGKKVKVIVKDDDQQISFQFDGVSRGAPLNIPELFPYGSGFIGWGIVPGVEMRGKINLPGLTFRITPDWFCYHDHNYGRFRWGSPAVGWVWWTASMRTKNGKHFNYIFHRGNNKDFTKLGSPYLFIYENNVLRKTFIGEMVKLKVIWSKKPEKPAILPGTMTSVFSNRYILMPEKIIIQGDDDQDSFYAELLIESKVEFILPDYAEKQYTFLKELNGSIISNHSIQNCEVQSKKGSFYAEYVH